MGRNVRTDLDVDGHIGVGATGSINSLIGVNIGDAIAANSGAYAGINVTDSIDAASGVSTSASLQGALITVSTGNVATAFTGNLIGLQFLARHNSSGSNINLGTMYGMLGQSILGDVGATNTPTVGSAFGVQAQAINRSNNTGTVVSTELTACYAITQQVGAGTIALMRGVAAVLTSLAGVGAAGTSTLTVGIDLGFSFFIGGTHTTAIGLRLQAWPAGPTYSNGPYGLSVEGASSLNWLQGKTQIGNAVAGTRPTSIPALLTVIAVTLGDEVQRLTSVATNDDPTESVFQQRTTTTDATVTTIATVPLDVDTTTTIIANIIGRRTGGAAGAAQDGIATQVISTFQRGAQIGAVAQVYKHANNAACQGDVNYSANTARIQVQGAVNNNYTWHVTYRVYKVST